MSIKYNEHLRKSEVISQSDDSTVLRVLVTSFGSPDKKDLHNEFFHQGTYFGDDKIKTKHALYEHMMNSLTNPYMPVQKQHLGAATLAKTDDFGRWFDFEISRSLEYHDFLVAMASKGVLGASTQCFPNGKVMDASVPGKIDYWLESEVSLTPTPADPKTIGEVFALAKSLGVGLQMVKDGSVVDVNLEALEVEEIPVAVVDEEVDADAIAADLEAALNGTPEPEEAPVESVAVPENIDDLTNDELKSLIVASVKATNAALEAVNTLKASMNVYIDMWGDVEEVRAALAAMMATQKAVTDEVIPMVSRINKKADATVKTTESFIAFIKNFKESEAGQRFMAYTPTERAALTNIENELPADSYHPKAMFGSMLPAGAPGV